MTEAKAPLSSATRTALPDSAFACPEKRLYPHHKADGSLDLPHLRNALARIADPSKDQCGKAHLEAHARNEGIGGRAKAFMPIKAKPLDDDEETAFWDGRVPRQLLAIPFGGPIPSAKSKKGVDLDDEWFDEDTDIFGPYKVLRDNRERLVDFQHSYRPPGPRYGDDTGMMTGHLVGKSILHPDPDEDGWWVDLWVERGNARVALIRRLAEKGAQLFGSSQPVGKTRVEPDGHISLWPFWMETLTTAPQNTFSVVRPKSVLDEAELSGIMLPESLRALATEIDSLSADLQRTSVMGSSGAGPGRSPVMAALDGAAKAVDRLLSVSHREVPSESERSGHDGGSR